MPSLASRSGRSVFLGLALWTALLPGPGSQEGADPGAGAPEGPAEPESVALHAPAEWLLPDEAPPGLEDVVREMRAGRFWHAGRLLRRSEGEALGSPGAILLAARAEAGWENWPEVRRLLAGRDWLPGVEGGVGLALRARAAEGEEAWEAAAEDYARYIRAAGEDGGPDVPVARVRRALSLARAGRVDGALDELGRVGEALGPFVGSWVARAAAGILSEEGLPGGTELALERITDEDARRGTGTLVARAHLEAGDTAGALEAFREVVGRTPGDRLAGIWTTVGELSLARGDTVAATGAFRRALEPDEGGGAAADAAEALLELGALATGDAARAAADVLLRAGREERGLQALELSMELLEEGPDDLPLRLRLLRARLLAIHGSQDEAARELLHLGGLEESSVAAPALWHLARLRRRQGRASDARAVEDRLVEEHPGRPEGVDVVFFRGDDAHDRGRLERAAESYLRAVEMAPALNRSGLARMRLGQIHLERDDPSAAMGVFEAYLAEFPRGRRWEQAAYWAARSRLELGDTAAARRHVDRIREDAPLSYYAVLGAKLAGDGWAPPPADGTESSESPAWLTRGLDDVDLFRNAGLQEGVAAMVDRLAARARALEPAAPVLLTLAEALNRRGLTMEGINLGWEVRGTGRGWDLRLLRVVYPLPYREVVFREAEEWGVDPFLAAAIIRQESAFWHRAVSRAGAVGLMQVLPSTGESLARAVGPEAFVPDVLTTPEVNVHLGMRFLKDMTDRFGPGLPVILSAYNAGPSRARRWRRLPEAEDPLRFTERIPFTETRGYVKNVVRNRAVYAWLYGDAPGD